MATSKKIRQVQFDRRIMISIVVAVAVFGLVVAVFTLPARRGLAKQQQKTAQDGAQAQSLTARIKDVQSGKATSAQDLLSQAQALDAKLPKSLDSVTVATAVSSVAVADGLTVKSVNPTGSAATAGVTFQVSVGGEPAAVAKFVSDLTSDKFGYVVTVHQLKVNVAPAPTTPPAGGGPAVSGSSATFSLTAWQSAAAPLVTNPTNPTNPTSPTSPSAPVGVGP